jgi:hypothetical protein
MLVEVEDQIAQAGQGLVADRSAEHLGRSDAGVIFFRRVLGREFAALAEGRATKNWRYMAELPRGSTFELL